MFFDTADIGCVSLQTTDAGCTPPTRAPEPGEHGSRAVSISPIFPPPQSLLIASYLLLFLNHTRQCVESGSFPRSRGCSIPRGRHTPLLQPRNFRVGSKDPIGTPLSEPSGTGSQMSQKGKKKFSAVLLFLGEGPRAPAFMPNCGFCISLRLRGCFGGGGTGMGGII